MASRRVRAALQAGFLKRFEPRESLAILFWVATEWSHDAPDDACYCSYWLDCRRNLRAVAAGALDRTIDCRHAVVAGIPYDSRRRQTPRAGYRGSIADLSGRDEAVSKFVLSRRLGDPPVRVIVNRDLILEP